jgi:hypothetical protein
MKTALRLGAALALLSMTAAASAQGTGGSATTGAPVGFPSDYGYSGGYGYHASTFEEGVLRGAADLTRATGEANYYHSLAAVNYQEAAARAIVNREQAVATYFRVRDLNRTARQASRPKPLSTEQYAALAKKQAPSRLSALEYDRASGRLAWPTALLADDFAAERTLLDDVFARRTTTDAGAGSPFHSAVDKLSLQLQGKLQQRIKQMNPMEFVAARKFLSGLSHEARLPLVLDGLAGN